MIINEKIIKFLNNDLNILTKSIKEKIIEDKQIRMYSLLEYFNFHELNYTFDDFLKDNYPKDVKEKKALYLILCEYKSVANFCDDNQIDKADFFRLLRIGIDKLPKTLYNKKNKFIKYFSMEYNISNFDIKIYKKHIELFGEKYLLEDFRNRHKIKYPVRYDFMQESWHLAFDGPLAEYISYQEKKGRK